MQYARCFYSYEDLTRAASKYIWEISDLDDLQRALEKSREAGTLPSIPVFSWQKELKQVFLRTDWSQNALSLMFACRTPIQNQHAHMDPAGFDFTGKPLLVDPGIYCYRDDENRRKFKSVHWHNCLTLNHQDPWRYISSWSYGEQQPGEILHAEENGRLMYAVAEHRNYQPAVHKRAWLTSTFWSFWTFWSRQRRTPVYRSIFILIHQQWLPIPQNPVSARSRLMPISAYLLTMA